MHVLSATPVVDAGNPVLRLIIDTYFEPSKSLREVRDILIGGHLDPLRRFSEACRENLSGFRST